MLSLKNLDKKEKIIFKYIYQERCVLQNAIYDNFISDNLITDYPMLNDDMEVQLQFEMYNINSIIKSLHAKSLINLFKGSNNFMYVELTSDITSFRRNHKINNLIK